MVAYLTKFDASKGFNQVIDFQNGSYLKYALTVNPNIYVSCIKQFWNTISIKQVNDITMLQALVDKKKVVVTEAAIREVLRLDDAEGVDCLHNEEIFTELARMGYEKPSTKLTFYKAFFSSQRVGKGFSRVKTPLFEGMLVGQKIKEEGDADEHVEDVTASDDAQGDDTIAHGEVLIVTQEPSIPSPTLTIPPSQPPQDIPSTSQTISFGGKAHGRHFGYPRGRNQRMELQLNGQDQRGKNF
nr:xylulose kinase-1 [Tanacetum cinerariifolium]